MTRMIKVSGKTSKRDWTFSRLSRNFVRNLKTNNLRREHA